MEVVLNYCNKITYKKLNFIENKIGVNLTFYKNKIINKKKINIKN